MIIWMYHDSERSKLMKVLSSHEILNFHRSYRDRHVSFILPHPYNQISICVFLSDNRRCWLVGSMESYKHPALVFTIMKSSSLMHICNCWISAHQSKTHSDESRPELLLKLTLSSLAVSVLHIDPLPPPDASHSPLGSMATHFFSTVGPGHLAATDFLQSRKVFDQACPHDHLRCTFDLLLNPFVHDSSWHLVEDGCVFESWMCIWCCLTFTGLWARGWR